MKTFPLVEIFGPTIQGEGADIGRLSTFIRFAGCDFSCEWCDSQFAADVKSARQVTAAHIMDELCLHQRTEWIVITGGNPLLYELSDLVDALHSANYKIAVETQGSIYKDWVTECDLVNLSPKPPSARARSSDNLGRFLTMCKCSVKMVAFDDKDLHYIVMLKRTYPKSDFIVSVGSRKSDTTTSYLHRYKTVLELVAKDPALNDVRVLPQMQFILWGRRRGV